MDFIHIKRTRTKKRKVMLWMDEYDAERLTDLQPREVTLQEKIRQIIKDFLESDADDDLDGL